jgi:hypothetical protein
MQLASHAWYINVLLPSSYPPRRYAPFGPHQARGHVTPAPLNAPWAPPGLAFSTLLAHPCIVHGLFLTIVPRHWRRNHAPPVLSLRVMAVPHHTIYGHIDARPVLLTIWFQLTARVTVISYRITAIATYGAVRSLTVPVISAP